MLSSGAGELEDVIVNILCSYYSEKNIQGVERHNSDKVLQSMEWKGNYFKFYLYLSPTCYVYLNLIMYHLIKEREKLETVIVSVQLHPLIY
jgi:hypothetical protein